MDTIKHLLETIIKPDTGLSLKKVGLFFWGKSSEGSIVYGAESKNPYLSPITQSTKYLKVFLNTKFEVSFDRKTEVKNLSLIELKSEGSMFLDIFIRLTITIDDALSDKDLLSYFLNLRDLFSNDSKKSIRELQGLYGELYSMLYLYDKYNLDISNYYQSEDKRKFDFSVSDAKKIEVKTTTLSTRIHHFRLEQLNTLRYDIIIVSIMLQKDDSGISLLELINKTKSVFSNNLQLMIHIEKMIKNIDREILETISYSKTYSDDNIKLFMASDTPRIQEKTMDGVFNVEFDSDLSTANEYDPDKLREWLN